MEALQSSPGVTTFPGEKDKAPRGATLVLVEIDNRMPGQTLAGGHVLNDAGRCQVEILARDLDRIRRTQVWDGDPDDHDESFPKEADKVREAERECFAEMVEDFRQHYVQNEGKVEFFRRFSRLLKSDNLSEQDSALVSLWKSKEVPRSPRSMEACFYRRWGRSVKPFRSLDVLKSDIPLPEEVKEFNKNKAVIAALGEPQASVPPDILSKLEAVLQQNAELQARVEELEEAQTKPKKKT